MKTKIILTILVMLAGAYSVQADTVWLSGHHEIVDGDDYIEIVMYNDATATMFGGHVYAVITFDATTFSMLDGEVVQFEVHDDSIIDLYGGTLNKLESAGNSSVNIHAYDVMYDPTGGHYGRGWLEGKYFYDNSKFGYSLVTTDTYSHLIVVSQRVVDAEIDIDPDTLNLASKGKWITCYIWLPEDYNVADIEPNSVVLEAEPNDIYPDWIWFNEKQNVVMARFPRSEIAEILEPGDVELTVTGKLADGTVFTGTDTIKVIDKGRSRRRRVNSNSKVVDGIEYYIQTDKSLYRLGEHVQMLYRVTNLGDENVTFGYFALPVWNFWVEKNEEYIWRAVNGWYGTITEFTLSPGESREFPAHDHPRIWNMRDKENNLVNVGKYSVIGGLYNGSGSCDYTKVAVPIRIVPKPAHASPKNK